MEFNTINECKEKILSKKISILELNKIFIDRIKQQKNLNSFIYFDEDLIIKRSNYLENLNDNNLSLKGIPLGLKISFVLLICLQQLDLKFLVIFNQLMNLL